MAVKESKKRYEKLKFDLGEKIDMVSASRCNLLSRSLPNYQKEVLSYYDEAANEFHKILVDLRSHHHHQYKVRRLAEEIRDLELEESPFRDETGMLGPSGSSDDVPLLDVGSGPASSEGPQKTNNAPPKRMLGSDQISIEKIQEEAKVKDLALSGIEAQLKELQNEVLQPSSMVDDVAPGQQPSSQTEQQQGEGARAKDKDELDDEFRDLLQLDDDVNDGTGGGNADGAQSTTPQDKLFDDWSSFSAFMSTSDPEERTKSPTAGWEKELMSPTSDANSLLGMESQEGGVMSPTTPTAGTSQSSEDQKNHSNGVAMSTAEGEKVVAGATEKGKDDTTNSNGGDKGKGVVSATGNTVSGGSSDLLADDLKALGIPPDTTPPAALAPKPALGEDIGSLDPSYFAQQLPPHPIMSSTTGVPQLSAPPSSTMMITPPPASGQQAQQQPQMFRSPQSNSQRPILATALASTYQPSGPGYMMPPLSGGAGKLPSAAAMGSAINGRHVSEAEDKEKEKAASWMNVFAHLDPLVNEKV